MIAFRPARRALMLAVAACAMSQPAVAQTYPAQNITLVVGFAAGGIADVVARLIGGKLSEKIGQTVVVENRGGAGGNLAARSVSVAAADGYTLLATTTALAVNDTASKNKGYNTDDLRPVAMAAISPDVLAVHPSNPAKDLKEFINNGKSKSFTYGTAGLGTGPQIAAEYFFREMAKVQAVHVPFTGGAPAIQAGVGNHVDALALSVPPVTPLIKQGTLRGLALASATRSAAVPDVPTYAEMGFPAMLAGSWVGFFAPAKTSDAIVMKLNAAINEILKQPDVQEKLKSIGFEPIFKSHPDTVAYFKSEVETWGKMVRAVGQAAN